MGFLAGPGLLNLVPVDPHNPVVERLAELALFSVLFTDGMKVRFRALVAGWELPTRALVLGLPLTLLTTALLGRLLGGLSWTESLLVGAVLSPTDPVFAAALVGRHARSVSAAAPAQHREWTERWAGPSAGAGVAGLSCQPADGDRPSW